MGDHLQDVFDYVVGDDRSEMAKIKAEHAYALHALEREIAICAKTQKQNDALVDLVQTLLDNEPDYPIADNGATVLDGWREQAKRVLGRVGNAGGGS